jgi:hypothetical protein
MMRRLARTSRVEVATLARASVMLVLAATGGVVAANAGSALIVYAPYAMVGAILVIKRPGNGIGWLLTAFAWQFAIGFLPVQATVDELQSLTAPSIVLAIAWFKVSLGLPLAFALLAFLAVVFPTGRLPRGRWRRPTMLLLLAMGAITLSAAVWPVLQVQPEGIDQMIVMPNPLQILPPGRLDEGLGDFPTAAGLVTFALLIASIGSMLARYARSDGIERLQLRWLVTGLAAVAIAVPVGFLLFATFGSAIEGVAWLPATIAFMLPPIAIGIAVLRYRLYEIDRIISRTIGWALVTSILVAVFAGTVVGLQALLDRVTQGETLSVAASTLVAFALFQPVRRRVQTAVDRRFDRARYDGDRTAAAFTERLREQVDLAGLEADITETVGSALRPRSLGVWIRGPGAPAP